MSKTHNVDIKWKNSNNFMFVSNLQPHSFHFKNFSLKYLNMTKTFRLHYTITVSGFCQLPLLILVKMLSRIFERYNVNRVFSVASDAVPINIFKKIIKIWSTWISVMGIKYKVFKSCTKWVTTCKVNWRRGSNLDKFSSPVNHLVNKRGVRV